MTLHLFFSFSVIESQNKANKDRLRNLQKARLIFQDHLGLEIRTILGKTQLVKGIPNKYMTIFCIVFGVYSELLILYIRNYYED